MTARTIEEEEQARHQQGTNDVVVDDAPLTVVNLDDDVYLQQGVDLDDDDDDIPTADAIELMEEGGIGGGDESSSSAATATTTTTTTIQGVLTTTLTMIASEASTRGMNLIEAIGKPLYPASSTDASESSSSFDDNNNEADDNNASRAEFVSATIVEKPAATKAGLRLAENEEDGTVRIAEVEADGMFLTSPLREGDILLSVNGIRCTGLAAVKVAIVLTEAAGTVTLVARNIHGNARRVESMFQKGDSESSVGFTLRRRRGRPLQISRLAKNGIAAHSLLNPGDRVLSINGVRCDNLSTLEAKEVIRRATRDVTVVAETRTSRGVVVSAASARRRSGSTGNAARRSSSLEGEQRAIATALDGRSPSFSGLFPDGREQNYYGEIPWGAVFFTMITCFVVLGLTKYW